MGRGARRDRRPYIPPVERIELSKDHIRTRWIATFFFLAIGVASLAIALHSSLTPEVGWEEIPANASGPETCANEFVFMYNLGAGEKSASAEKRELTALYTEATDQAYRLFHSSETFDGVQNIASINSHPNETVSVDPALYAALELLNRSDVRLQYLGPAYEIYNGVFNCQDDFQTLDFDPVQNESVRGLFAEIAAYAEDAEAVKLELLGNNQVCLHVSDAYLQFANENETTDFLDLNWMKNAFAADFIAQKMTDAGYTRGVLSSYDGFVRNLDDSGTTAYQLMLFDRKDQTVYPAAVMQYGGPKSLVYLRAYPAAGQDLMHYYTLENGEIRVPYLDARDGLPKACVGGLASYTETGSCAEILLRVIPEYVCDTFREEAILALAEDGIESVWCQNGVLSHTEDALVLREIHPDETVRRAGQ